MAKKKRKTKKSRKSNPGKKRTKKTGKGRRSNPNGKRHHKRRKNPSGGLGAAILGGAVATMVGVPAAHLAGKMVHSEKSPHMHTAAKVVARIVVEGGLAALTHGKHPNFGSGAAGALGGSLVNEGGHALARHSKNPNNFLAKLGFGAGHHIEMPSGGHIHHDGKHVKHMSANGEETQLMGVRPTSFTLQNHDGTKELMTAMAALPDGETLVQNSMGNLEVLRGISLPQIGEIVRVGEFVKLGSLGEIVNFDPPPRLEGHHEEAAELEGVDDAEPSRHGYRPRS